MLCFNLIHCRNAVRCANLSCPICTADCICTTQIFRFHNTFEAAQCDLAVVTNSLFKHLVSKSLKICLPPNSSLPSVLFFPSYPTSFSSRRFLLASLLLSPRALALATLSTILIPLTFTNLSPFIIYQSMFSLQSTFFIQTSYKEKPSVIPFSSNTSYIGDLYAFKFVCDACNHPLDNETVRN